VLCLSSFLFRVLVGQVLVLVGPVLVLVLAGLVLVLVLVALILVLVLVGPVLVNISDIMCNFCTNKYRPFVYKTNFHCVHFAWGYFTPTHGG